MSEADEIEWRERQRWADAMELERRTWREGPQTPEARTAASILGEWMNRLRFNEPGGRHIEA